MGEYGQGQTRAQGLTRAILDTFPVIKFSRLPTTRRDLPSMVAAPVPKPPDVESGSSDNEVAMEMAELPASGQHPSNSPTTQNSTAAPIFSGMNRGFTEEGGASSPGAGPSSPRATIAAERQLGQSNAQATADASAPAPVSSSTDANTDSPNVMPEAIGRETCPICIIDFEEDDDIRVLPCEGRHVFHQACVDPWLLDLSSSCPICRQGTWSSLTTRFEEHY